MVTIKKWNITVSEPPTMSAFALRKRLLGEQTATASSGEDRGDEETSTPSTPEVVKFAKTRSSKRARKNPSRQPASSHEGLPSAPQEVLLLDNQPENNTYATDAAGDITRSPLPSIVDEAQPRLDKALPVQLSSFKPSKSNSQNRKDGRIVLKLSDGERLVILGSYGIRVTSGEVTINGATLRSSGKVHWVDAPHCHALPVIRCSDATNLELLPHPSTANLRSLGRLSPQFRKLWNESIPYDSTFQILYTSADGPKKTTLQDLVSPPEWNREIVRLVNIFNPKPCSIMITGPKSSGKSTFGKILANRLLTDQLGGSKQRVHRGVAVLDIDPGQPEYCIAGQIALILLNEPVSSPSFCHPLPGPEFKIIRSHALASISPASDPELYVEAALDLMTHYRNALGRYPLVINTPGWIQGTGLDLLTSLIADLRPTEVIYMSESGPAEAVEALQESCKTTGFSTLPSQASQLASRTAAHFRSMQTMSYFHAESQGSDGDERGIQWNPKPLTTVPPWQVSYRGPNRGIFGIMCYDYQAPLDLLADTINGTILAVVGVESTKAFRYSEGQEELCNDATGVTMDIDDNDGNDEHQKSIIPSFSSLAEHIIDATPEGIPFIDTANGITLDPRYSHSLGLVLVRGIDVENGLLQLLTPLSAEIIEEVTSKGGEIVLVSGKFDAPSWAYTEELYHRSYGEADDGAELDERMETAEEGTSEASDDGFVRPVDTTTVPWIEVLHGNQKRGAGSKVWRVRRDLGRGANVAN